MSSLKYNGYANFDSNVVKEVMEITEKIEKEKQNAEPDKNEMTKLMYQQLIKGMNLNSGFRRNYKLY